MKRGRNEKDRNHYPGRSCVRLIAARLGVDMPEARLDIYNRGERGNKVATLHGFWPKDAIGMTLDLLSTLIGVNDVGPNLDSVDVTQGEADDRFILDASRQANPDLRFVLPDPFILASGRLANAETFRQWRDQVERLLPIDKQLAADYHAVHMEMQESFDAAAKAVSPEHWIWGGVHLRVTN